MLAERAPRRQHFVVELQDLVARAQPGFVEVAVLGHDRGIEIRNLDTGRAHEVRARRVGCERDHAGLVHRHVREAAERVGQGHRAQIGDRHRFPAVFAESGLEVAKPTHRLTRDVSDHVERAKPRAVRRRIRARDADHGRWRARLDANRALALDDVELALLYRLLRGDLDIHLLVVAEYLEAQ